MRLLFIGGTDFVGRHIAAEAIGRGHDTTLFHRGHTGAGLFPEAEHVLGDRAHDLGKVSGREWDAVIDVCAYVPREVRQAAAALAGSADRYCYVSTTDVYRRTGAAGIDEDSPLHREADLDDPRTEVVDADTYGPLKALCEEEARAGFGDAVLTIRPTYVLGPYDNTDRFTYWVRRTSEGGEVLAPGPAEAPQQLIDARDLATFTVRLLESGVTGAFNGVAPTVTFGEMLATCIEATGADARLVWAGPELLAEHGVELPLWNPPEEYEILRCDPARSLDAGLRIRPLAQTVRDTLAWDRDRGLPPLEGAPDSVREQELINASR